MIEVKNVKHSEFASEETMCFQCSVYWDGKKAGFAKNSGTGGETYIYWDDRALEKSGNRMGREATQDSNRHQGI